MPKYSFECQVCQTRFDRTLKMGEYPLYACPSCREDAPRIFTGFGFGFVTPGAKAPGNSGVHDQDYPSADKAVGRSAEARWSEYRERDKVKKKVRETSGSSALLRYDGDGFVDYDAMTASSKKGREKVVDYAVAVSQQPIVAKPGA